MSNEADVDFIKHDDVQTLLDSVRADCARRLESGDPITAQTARVMKDVFIPFIQSVNSQRDEYPVPFETGQQCMDFMKPYVTLCCNIIASTCATAAGSRQVPPDACLDFFMENLCMHVTHALSEGSRVHGFVKRESR